MVAGLRFDRVLDFNRETRRPNGHDAALTQQIACLGCGVATFADACAHDDFVRGRDRFVVCRLPISFQRMSFVTYRAEW